MNHLKIHLTILFVCMFCTLQAQAVTLMIGDKDGFGYGNASGYLGADGNPAERAGNRTILDMGDCLPDLNHDGFVEWSKSGDNFDYRSVAERNDPENNGVKWTDVSLSLSYDNRPGRADDAVFIFRFTPPAVGDVDYGRNHFISLVYGDYDVDDVDYGRNHFNNLVYGDYDVSMTIEIDGLIVELLGNQEGGVDGYIWRAYATVNWNDVKDGEIVINVNANHEPYVAFDYVILDVTPLDIANPTPASWLNLLLGSK